MRNRVWTIGLITMAAARVLSAADQNVTALAVTPAELVFRSADEGMRVLVIGTTAEGDKIDLSEQAQFDSAEAIVKRGADGLLYGAVALPDAPKPA